MWFDEAVIYQIYPLGLCGAPKETTGRGPPHPLAAGLGGPHQALGADTVLLNPVFDSDRHGYDTGTILRWTLGWGAMKIWPRCAGRSIRPASG